jgi:hypothetical protein
VETFVLLLSLVVGICVVGFLVGSMLRSIRNEKRRSNLKRTWMYFGLSISLAVLFFVSWIGQGFAEWQVYGDEQRAHGEPVEVGGYIVQFAQSTFENWQSEFLQLFSFVVLAALLIHKGSAESKDSDEQMQKSLDRIERRLEELTGSGSKA